MNAKTEADCLQRWLCAFGTTAAIVAATGCANVGSHPVETEPERPRFVPSAAAAAQIAKVAFADPETDPRSGAGYSREELFALHQELRALAQRNYRRAPSAREKEILRCILHGKPGRRIDTRPIVDKMMKKRDEEEKVSLFYDGYSVNWNMYHYRRTVSVRRGLRQVHGASVQSLG